MDISKGNGEASDSTNMAGERAAIIVDYARESDMDAVMRLHEECFPLSYDTKFYQSIFVDRKYGGCSVVTIVAYSDSSRRTLIGSAIVQLKGRARDKIDNWESILHEDLTKNEEASASYLMTLAVTARYRRHGVASMILQRVVDIVYQDPFSYAIYLHVLAHNKGAQLFYERFGFIQLTRIKDFYYIDDTYHDSFIYSLYFREGKPPSKKSIGDYFSYAVESILNIITFIPRMLISVGQDDEEDEQDGGESRRGENGHNFNEVVGDQEEARAIESNRVGRPSTPSSLEIIVESENEDIDTA